MADQTQQPPPAMYAYLDPSAFQASFDTSLARPTSRRDSWHPKVGGVGDPQQSMFRFMPPHPNMLVTRPDGSKGPDFIITNKVHFGLGPKGDTWSPCLDPYGIRCPACTWNDDVWRRVRSGQKDLRDLAYDTRSQWRFTSQIVDMAVPELGVQQYHFGPDLEKKYRMLFYDDYKRFIDLTHPVTGRNIIVQVSTKPGGGKRPYPQYDLVKRADDVTAIDPKWLEQISDLTEKIFQPTEAEVMGALSGIKIDRDGTANVLPGAALPGVRSIGGGTTVGAAPGMPIPMGPGALPPMPPPSPAPSVPVMPPPVATAPPPAATSIPTDVSTPAPPATAGRRGGRRAAAEAPAAPVAAPGSVPVIPVQPPAPPGAGPVPMAPAVQAPQPLVRWATARTHVAQQSLTLGMQFTPITPDEAKVAVADVTPPVSCYKLWADVGNATCQTCPLLLPCLSHRYGWPN